MTPEIAKAFGEELAGIVKAATDPLIARIASLEETVKSLPSPTDGKDGKDADPNEVAEIAAGLIELPEMPELPDIAGMIEASIAEAVSTLPKPQDGKDGAPGPQGEKGDKGEPGRDGLDVKDLFRADEGRLVAVMSDGTTKDLGVFVGSDGKDGADGRDGADGLGFDDLEFSQDDEGRPIVKFTRGDVVKSIPLPCIIDRGTYKSGQAYQKGDAVSFGGSLWIAQEKTSEKPDGGAGWRLAVKKGRDAREPKVRSSDA